MFNAKDEEWVVEEELTLQEREILFLTAEAAGMIIYPSTRINKNVSLFPDLTNYASQSDAYPLEPREAKHIAGCKKGAAPSRQRKSYQEILESLRNIIRDV